MSNLNNNTAQLELLLAKVKALPEGSSQTGEDVTEEINAYTAKIASLERVVTTLEAELEGKASMGTVQTATVSVSSTYPTYPIYYVGPTGVKSSTHSASTFTCVVPSILCLNYGGATISISGNIQKLVNQSPYAVFSINGDGTITLTPNDYGVDD